MNSKAIGNANEAMLDLLCKANGIYVVKIPDGCRRLGKNKLISVKSPFDRILARKGKAAFVDYKHTKNAKFSYSMINREQVNTLIGLECEGQIAGFLVYFEVHNRIIFFRASLMFNMTPGSSLHHMQGIDCGTQLRSNLIKIFL